MAVKKYRIHPSIGICRVGNAGASSYYLSPSIPWQNASFETTSYRDQFDHDYKKNGKIRPQATRFTIWEYDSSDKPLREINLESKDVESIGWQVELINLQPAMRMFELGITGDISKYQFAPAPRKISGKNQGGKDAYRFSKSKDSVSKSDTWITELPDANNYLGELFTDGTGNLIVVGGTGNCGVFVPTIDPDSQIDYDDTSNGFVSASVKFKSGTKSLPVDEAVILVSPPSYAPQHRSIVTFYDLAAYYMLLYKKTKKHKLLKLYPPLDEISKQCTTRVSPEKFNLGSYKPGFHNEIAPILHKAFEYGYLNKHAHDAHVFLDLAQLITVLNDPSEASKNVRTELFEIIKPPLEKQKKSQKMPKLYGSNTHSDKGSFTLTPLQYEIMKKWAEGDFEKTTGFTKIEAPASLDIASMEYILGGGFDPGIDISKRIVTTENFSVPFRIQRSNIIGPGVFRLGIVSPWQDDIVLCLSYWPTQAPSEVIRDNPDDMQVWLEDARGSGVTDRNILLKKWDQLGIVQFDKSSKLYIEKERGKI